MQPALELDKLTKIFTGNRGIHEVSLVVPEAQIVGFLGPNGAGKTTTMSTLIGLTKPTSGRIHMLGKDGRKQNLDIRRDIGFLASDMALDGGLTGWQQLEYFGNLRGQFDRKYVSQLAKRLNSDLHRKFRRLSRGNKQKVALIAALMHKPKLLLLDEPTSGLDPLIQAEFNKIILEHRDAGNTAFISSHVLSEVQELCDSVIFIREGRVVAQKSIRELTEAAPKQARIVSEDKTLFSQLKKLEGIANIDVHDGTATFAYTGKGRDLIKLLAKHTFSDFTLQDTDLEQVFMTYYENREDADA